MFPSSGRGRLLRRIGFNRIRPWLISMLLVAGIALNAWAVDHHYPIQHWLALSYFRAWAFAAFGCVASLAAGWRVLGFVLPRCGRLHERLLMAFALGILAFYAGMFLGGIAKLYHPAFFFALPIALLIFAGRKPWADTVRTCGRLRHFGVRLWTPRSVVEWLAAALLILLVVGAYLQEMLPSNMCFDARWYHLPIAEHYVAAGGIVRFEEGWYLGAYPQLASLLYAWALLAPGTLHDHVLLCSHLEFCLFLATLWGMTVLTERIVGRVRLPFAAAGVGLFPGLFVYDSNLNNGADHILAFWGPPIVLSLLRLERDFSGRKAAYSGLVTAGALCTKYQACYFFVPAALCVSTLTLARRKITPALVWGGAVALVTASHWLKNLIYYHDPLYPLLHAYFPSRPFHRGATALVEHVYWPRNYDPAGATLLERLWNAVRTSATFAFIADGGREFPGNGRNPFGTFFTLLTPILLLLRPRRRLWIVVAVVYLGLLTWYMTSHQQRFLQTLMPCMAAATVAILVIVRRYGWVTYGPILLAVAAQLIGNADVYFTPYHAMLGESPLRPLVDYLGKAYKREYAQRYEFVRQERSIGERFPPGSKVLFHRLMLKFGLGAQTVVDDAGWQGAIEYLNLSSPSAVNALWARLGVTHFVWEPERDRESPAQVARELVLMRSLEQYARDREEVRGWQVASRHGEPRDDRLAQSPTRIAWLGCGQDLPTGIYSPRGVDEEHADRTLDPPDLASGTMEHLAEANAIALRNDCTEVSGVAGAIRREFVRTGRFGSIELWVRSRAH